MKTASSIALQDTTANEISQQVIEAVATKEGEHPVELEQPLYDAVDPDALDVLFSGPKQPETVRFTYLGYEVLIRGDGTIDVTDLDEQSA